MRNKLESQNLVRMDSTENLLHTANGELINPKVFITEWLNRGFPEDVLTKYAYGHLDESVYELHRKNNWKGETNGLIFQTTRIEIKPNQ